MKDERKVAAMAITSTLPVNFSSPSQYIKTSPVRNPPTANTQLSKVLVEKKIRVSIL